MIRTRLAIWNAVVLALVLSLIGVAVYFTTRANLYGYIDASLSDRVGFIVRNWEQFSQHPPPDRPPPGDRGGRSRDWQGPVRPGEGGPPNGMFLTGEDRGLTVEQRARFKLMHDLEKPRIITKDGIGFINRNDIAWDTNALQRSLKGETVNSDIVVSNERVRVLSVPLKSKGKVVAVGQAAALLGDTDSVMAKQGRILLELFSLALLLTTLTGIYLTRHALKPVGEFARAAERIEATSLGGRLPEKGHDEFAMLAKTFNSMLGRLEHSFKQLEESNAMQRRFVGDASHELKTPLTAIMTRVGVARRGQQTPERLRTHIDGIGASAEQMNVIVQDLLLLARSQENAIKLERIAVPVRDVVEGAITQVRPLGGAQIVVDVSEEIEVFADPNLLQRAIANILSNALRHTPDDGVVTVSCSSTPDRAVLTMKDTGEGIAPEHLSRVFERFYRVDDARDRERGGTGLGLAIVKSIIDAHGGTVKIESELGKGTTVTFSLNRLSS